MSSDLDFESIKNDLKDTEPDRRRQILMDISISEDPEITALIANYLGDPSPAVCEAAVEALSDCENLVAAEAAALHLFSTDPAERGYALETLVRLGRYALPSLTRLLGDPDHNIRKFATDAMASIRAPESLPTLLEALRSSDILVAAAAAEALGMLGNLDSVPDLGAAVEQGPDWLRISALTSLGKIGGEEALAWICRIPPDSPSFVQAAAVNAISLAGDFGSNSAYAFLASLLSPERPALEEEIVKTLGRWAIKEGLSAANKADLTSHLIPFKPVIEIALNSEDAEVRAAAVTCFGVTEDFEKSIIPQMFSDKEVVVRLAVLNTLALHGGISFEELARISMDEQEDVGIRIAGLHSLANIIQNKVPLNNLIRDGLIHLMNSAYEMPIRATAMRVLILSGAEEGNASVLTQLAEEEFATADDVSAELMLCPVDLLLPIAIKSLEQSDPDIRWLTFTALVSPERALEWAQKLDGQELIIAALSDDDCRIRVHAISVLGNCTDQAWARKLLCSACESIDINERVRAVDALGSGVGSFEELEILRSHLSDPSERVRLAAFRALTSQGYFEEDMLRRALVDQYPPLQQAALIVILATDRRSNWHLLWSLAEEVASQSTDPEIAELAAEIRLRLSQC